MHLFFLLTEVRERLGFAVFQRREPARRATRLDGCRGLIAPRPSPLFFSASALLGNNLVRLRRAPPLRGRVLASAAGSKRDGKAPFARASRKAAGFLRKIVFRQALAAVAVRR